MYGAILGDMVGAPYEYDMSEKRKDFLCGQIPVEKLTIQL